MSPGCFFACFQVGERKVYFMRPWHGGLSLCLPLARLFPTKPYREWEVP